MIRRCDLLPQYKNYKKEIGVAINRVLESGRYTLAEEVDAFEEESRKYFDVKHAITVASGTDALILSLKACDIGVGDKVITSPFTAIPTVSAIIAVGATPVFVDICEDSFLLDLNQVSRFIDSKTKAIVPVHIFGNVVDIPALRKKIGQRLYIIEDAAQAHGSNIGGIKAGTMGDFGAFSFYPTKNLGAYGDGGMIVTNDDGLAEKIRLLRMYGMIDKDQIIINGINSRLDEIQAAILRVKLKYLDEMNNRRNEIAERYLFGFKSSQIMFQKKYENVFTNQHVFSIKIKNHRTELIQFLDENKIQTNIYYKLPLHLQKANEYLGYCKGDFPVTEDICKSIMALPMYAELNQKTVDFIIANINRFFNEIS